MSGFRKYLFEAQASLHRARRTFEDGDLIWTTIIAYYAEYYALEAFLQRIGIRTGSHTRAISFGQALLGERMRTIRRHRRLRADAHEGRAGSVSTVERMLAEAEEFIAYLTHIVPKKSTERYRKKAAQLCLSK